MTQPTLFPISSPGTPERKSAGLRSGDALKEQGMRWAAENRKLYLETAKSSAKYLARNGAAITTDEIFEHWESIGLKEGPRILGNAAGSIFKGPEWIFVGWVKAKRAISRSRYLRSWRLR